jgi:hypothetical protein
LFHQINICHGDSFLVGGDYQFTEGSYYDTLVSQQSNCDSVIVTQLDVNTVEIGIVNNSPTITSNAIGADYQWLDCDNAFTPIVGEINQSFTATNSGNYAVEVMQNNCIDTSICEQINMVYVIENNFDEPLLIYPNPSFGVISIVLEGIGYDLELCLRNVTGQLVYKQVYSSVREITIETGLSPGLYTIELKTVNKVFKGRIVIE